MPSLALSLSSLTLGTSGIASAVVGTNKRKATSSGHYGAANDSSLAVRLVAISRLMRTRDEPILDASARTAGGEAVAPEATLIKSAFRSEAPRVLTVITVPAGFETPTSPVEAARFNRAGNRAGKHVNKRARAGRPHERSTEQTQHDHTGDHTHGQRSDHTSERPHKREHKQQHHRQQMTL